ncbi:hypothetical protein TUM4438_11920 [Shewanella sairae]|uniref:Uncharacterized protein n=1 Tax=Shewanella sairae TaxID=190310 RepID=A0ABQ4P704_9GAMM|nr:hypothetical protein TUM4438_11920 [Shewanella sairae]
MRFNCELALLMLLLIFVWPVKSTDFCHKIEFIQRDLGHVLRQHMIIKAVNVKLVSSSIAAIVDQDSSSL